MLSVYIGKGDIMKKTYAVYDKKTDELLVSGNSKFCTRQLGLASVDSFYSLVSNCLSGKNNKYEVLVEEVEGDV